MSLFNISVGFRNMISRYFSVPSILYDPAVSKVICSLIFLKLMISLNYLCVDGVYKLLLVHEAELLFTCFHLMFFK